MDGYESSLQGGGTQGGVGSAPSSPLATALTRRVGQPNDYGNDPNHTGFATGAFDSMKTGAQGAMQMAQTKDWMQQRAVNKALQASQAKPSITRTGTQPI